jgi:CarD family transcriptional regulator
MTLRVPVNKVEAIDAQAVVGQDAARSSRHAQGQAQSQGTMWSRRAQEYEAKINSGDLVAIAEVTRDLFRADDQPEQSYSERQIFEAASRASPANSRRWKRPTSPPRSRRSS